MQPEIKVGRKELKQSENSYRSKMNGVDWENAYKSDEEASQAKEEGQKMKKEFEQAELEYECLGCKWGFWERRKGMSTGGVCGDWDEKCKNTNSAASEKQAKILKRVKGNYHETGGVFKGSGSSEIGNI